MRVAPLYVALASAVLFGCAGKDAFTTGGGPPIGSELGDAGTTDAGAGADAGSDAGTTGTCTQLATPVNAQENCTSGGGATAPVSTTANIQQNGCSVTIFTGTNQFCSGTLSGPGNTLLNGTCNGSASGSCTTPRGLPGPINCTLASTQQCTIEICDASGVCPP